MTCSNEEFDLRNEVSNLPLLSDCLVAMDKEANVSSLPSDTWTFAEKFPAVVCKRCSILLNLARSSLY